MANVVTKVKEVISYWYLRYQLATELYMVEPWEKTVVHLLFAIIFGLFWYFNTTVVLDGISRLRNSTSHLELIE
ncbi:unnamed protein product [Chilo suppressalis]|uniref:Serine palmitoyltransferase small subunit A n=1 Tax=Chilo suppressalis TaxID=168631 RepID=A0ABN8B7C1_CHISP|nr:hypothetical protein evm_005392 [Chilo suppressalis]CAH0403735.1 unnamed protein product [Chilo suppressalis]